MCSRRPPRHSPCYQRLPALGTGPSLACAAPVPAGTPVLVSTTPFLWARLEGDDDDAQALLPISEAQLRQ